jgi:hypothetical protein
MTIPHDHDIEAAQLMLQINQEQIGDSTACHLGYIGGVDPTTNKIQVIFPTATNDDQTYMQSGWIPLGTMVAGNQFGIQLLPFGNGTVTNPTGEADDSNNNKTQAAEQVLVHVLNRQNGMYITGVQRFNNIDVPPSGYQDKSMIKAAAGEWLFKHASGSYQYYANDGELKLVSLTNPAPILQPKDAPDSVSQNLLLSAAAEGTNSNSNGDKVHSSNGTIELVADANGGSQNENSTINISAEQSNPEQTAQNTSAISVSSEVTAGTVGQANVDLTASSKGATQDNAEFTLSAETQNQGSSTGNITIDAGDIGTGNLNITVKGQTATVKIEVTGQTNEMDITVQDGTVNLTCDTTNVKSGTINLGTGTMKRILTDIAAQVYNSHTHGGVMSGDSTTSTPNQQIQSSDEAQNANAS